MEIINRGSRRILPIRRFVFAVFAFSLASATHAVESQQFVLQCPAPYDSVVAKVEAMGGEVTYQYENIGAVAVSIPADRRSELFSMSGNDSFVAKAKSASVFR